MSLDWVPTGIELQSLRALVADDLVADEDLAEMIGPQFAVSRSTIPRVRPILVALAARSVGASQVDEEAQHAAEMLHLALRVHDLALGREGGRRRRVARRIVRHSVNWLTGNHLTLRALELSRLAGPAVLEELMDTLRAFSDAQARSRDLVGRLPEEDDWLEHADGHTGALFAFCCRVGGQLAGAPVAQVTALGRYGRHVGRLWHVAEDVAGLTHGDPGTHLASRAALGRPMLPLICAAAADPPVGAAWRTLPLTDGDHAAALAQRVVEAGLLPSRRVMVHEAWRAQRALTALPESRYRRGMERFVAELAKTFTRSESSPAAP